MIDTTIALATDLYHDLFPIQLDDPLYYVGALAFLGLVLLCGCWIWVIADALWRAAKAVIRRTRKAVAFWRDPKLGHSPRSAWRRAGRARS